MANATQTMVKKGQLPSVNPLMPWTMDQIISNGKARKAIKNKGKLLRQPVQSGSFTPVYGAGTTINIPPQAIGLTVRYILDITATVTNPAGGGAMTRSGYGPWAMLSNIQYQNPSQYTPINTTGWHLYSVMCLRARFLAGAAFTTDSPTGFGSVIQPVSCPATLAASTAGTVTAQYEIPLAYDPEHGNFQGAVYAGTTLSNQNIQFTWNPNFAVVTGTDPYNTVFVGASAGTPPTYAVSWTLYQEYIDQFDVGLINPLTPDLSTSYYLSTQPIAGVVANQDNQVPFGNLRTFFSLCLCYDNNGTLNAGTDINYFALVSANQLPFWKRNMRQQSWLIRNAIHEDFPQGYYGIDLRQRPVATQAQGNTVLNLNPLTAPGGTVITAGWEYLAVQSVLAGAPTLGA